MKDYITSLVQQTLHDYLKKSEQNRHLLVMCTNQWTESNRFWEHLKELSERYVVSFVCSEKEQQRLASVNIHHNYFVEKITIDDVQQFHQQFDLLYCPNISYGFLAKLFLLIDETVEVSIALEMLLNGKQVLLGNDTIVEERKKQFWHKYYIDQQVKQYMKVLQKDGIQFCSMRQAVKWIEKILKKNHDKKPLLLAKHVETVAEFGEKEIVVPSNCIITPMAKDKAKSLQMTIKIETNEKSDSR